MKPNKCFEHSDWRLCRKIVTMVLAVVLVPAAYQPVIAKTSESAETNANTQMFPKRILQTGVNLNVAVLSPNARQLSDSMGLSPMLERIQASRSHVAAFSGAPTLESLAARQDLFDAVQQASIRIQRTNLDVDFTIAEIDSELSVYREWHAACELQRSKALDATIITSGTTNLVLWAACEALTLPVIKHPSFITPSGIVGISAGVAPSIASMYALKAAAGKSYKSETNPNMLAKVFGNPGNEETDYPDSVWKFLNEVPAKENTNRSRRDQLIDRWIADTSIPTFTNRESKMQRDILTASGSYPKSLSIDTLNMRMVMLQQLAAEVMKMKRMLLELAMVVEGSKTFVVDAQ
jgi:hypothetical protein